MSLNNCLRGVLVIIPAFWMAPSLMAHAAGPDPGYSGAPGESTCTSCHSGGSGAPKGQVRIAFSGDGSTYTPGTKQTITISFAGGTAKGYGFQLTARIANDNTQAGDFPTPAPSGIIVLCANGSTKPAGKTCTNSAAEYIEHNRPSTTGTWTFDWNPPATASGTIQFNVAGNAAIADVTNNCTITTAVASLDPPSASVPKPAISAANGVTTAFNGRTGVVSSGWIEIKGTQFTTGAARDWTSDDFANGTPVSLDGISATVNGNPAFVRHISATQMEVQAPTDTATGPIQVIVTNGKTASDPVNVTKSAILPSVYAPFTVKTNIYVMAVLSDGSYAGPANGVVNVNLRPVIAGETVTFFGAGFGPVAGFVDGNDVAAGTITSQGNVLTNSVTIRIGSIQVPAANILYQGLALDAIGLYQFTVVLPSNLPSGDQAITFSAGGMDTAQKMLLTVKAIGEQDQ